MAIKGKEEEEEKEEVKGKEQEKEEEGLVMMYYENISKPTKLHAIAWLPSSWQMQIPILWTEMIKSPESKWKTVPFPSLV